MGRKKQEPNIAPIDPVVIPPGEFEAVVTVSAPNAEAAATPEGSFEIEELTEDERAEQRASAMRLAALYKPIRDILAELPLGSRVEFTRGEPDKYVVYRGLGVNQHGEGRTLARAIRVIGAQQEHDPVNPLRMILVDQAGVPIPPEE